MADFNIYDTAVQQILKKILQACHVRDWGYYEDLEIRAYSEENKKVRLILAVLVPEDDRDDATLKLYKQIKKYTYPVSLSTATGQTIQVFAHEKGKQLDVQISDNPKSPHYKEVVRIVIKPSKAGGVRGGSTGARITESAQCLYASLRFNVYNQPIPFPTDESKTIIPLAKLQKAMESCFTDATEEEMANIDLQWQKSCILGANKLFTELGSPPKGTYYFYRGVGLDAEVKDAYQKVKKEDNLAQVPGMEDKWNPADIWIAKTDFPAGAILQAAESGLSKNLNAFLMEQFLIKPRPDLVGVSLKQITTNSATCYPVNHDSVYERAIGIEYDGIRTTYQAADVYLKLGGTKEMQLRNFDGSSGAGWMGENQGVGAAQGKIGGALVWEILNRHGAGFVFNNQGEWTADFDSDKRKANAQFIFDSMKKYIPNGFPSDLNPNRDAQKILTLFTNDTPNEKAQSWRYAKKLGFKVAEVLDAMDEKKSSEAVQDLFLYASSQSAASSIHLKLT